MNRSIQNDIKQLEDMLESHNKLVAKLNDPATKHHEMQIINAACYMLKELMSDKTRDIRRRLRETREY